ncbi:MAG: ABC transporter ATP-binding protein [Aestuariivita sp.]|nr:ABC transporter ATP-binding protein [Aestuariivita sp.]MCY4345466.1 ABC transporter ATP-binding protein [Aestuariivita sp.]
MSLELKNVTKIVGVETHIHPTSLTFEAGDFNTLLGATNAGKSTLIRLLAGLEKPTSGQVIWAGQDVTGVSPQRRNISLVHQFFINYPHMTVYDNIASPLRVAKLPRSEMDHRVRETAELLQLEGLLARYPDELSGGQQQRTALARAIAKQSKAIFLDEPLANLDYKLREELREQLPTILEKRGTVIVYATTEPTEALLLGGFTALMHEGKVTQFGRTSKLYHSPASLTAARVFSDPPINYAHVMKEGNLFRLDDINWAADGSASSLSDGQYIVAIRPHHIAPYQTKPSCVRLEGQVQITELSGSESIAHFAVGKHSWVSLAPRTHQYLVGERHNFFFDPEQCFFFNAASGVAVEESNHG